MRNQHRFAIVITHEGVRKGLLDMDWLEKDHRVDESDWIVLSREGWRDVARGEASIWEALQRKLLIGLYVSQPELIAVIGHPLGGERPAVHRSQTPSVTTLRGSCAASAPSSCQRS